MSASTRFRRARIRLSGRSHAASAVWASATPERRGGGGRSRSTTRSKSLTASTELSLCAYVAAAAATVSLHPPRKSPLLRSFGPNGVPRRRPAGRGEGPRRQLHLRQEARRQAVDQRALPHHPQAARRRGGQVRREERLLRPRRHRQHHRPVGPVRL